MIDKLKSYVLFLFGVPVGVALVIACSETIATNVDTITEALLTALEIPYDNSGDGNSLGASTVQGAIDELDQTTQGLSTAVGAAQTTLSGFTKPTQVVDAAGNTLGTLVGFDSPHYCIFNSSFNGAILCANSTNGSVVGGPVYFESSNCTGQRLSANANEVTLNNGTLFAPDSKSGAIKTYNSRLDAANPSCVTLFSDTFTLYPVAALTSVAHPLPAPLSLQ